MANLELKNHRRQRRRRQRSASSLARAMSYGALLLLLTNLNNAALAQTTTTTATTDANVNIDVDVTPEEDESILLTPDPTPPPSMSPITNAPTTFAPITNAPSTPPTPSPTTAPTISPTISTMPTTSPSSSFPPTPSPTFSPSKAPTLSPSRTPSSVPSETPSTSPPTTTPTTSEPTKSPSGRPSSSPTDFPTKVASSEPSVSAFPSIVPTASFSPSAEPSSIPSMSPSVTKLPSISPSVSRQPSVAPSDPPSYSPVIAPSMMPSLTDETHIARSYRQQLTVSVPQSFDATQMGVFNYLYQQYTVEIGYQVGPDQILTKSTVLDQKIGINSLRAGMMRARTVSSSVRNVFHRARRITRNLWDRAMRRDLKNNNEEEEEESQRREDELRDRVRSVVQRNNHRNESEGDLIMGEENEHRALQQSNEEQIATGYPLTIRFSVKYSTRIGAYDITDYNQRLMRWVNADKDTVLKNMNDLGLPVVKVGSLLILTEVSPTMKPSEAPTPLPTLKPVTMEPTLDPSNAPTTSVPTSLPSEIPSAVPPPSGPEENITDNFFVLGLSLGLAGAFMISGLGLLYYRHMEKKAAEERKASANANAQTNSSGNGGGGDGGYAGNQHPGLGTVANVDEFGNPQHHHRHESGDQIKPMGGGGDQMMMISKSTIELTPNDDGALMSAEAGSNHPHQHPRQNSITDENHQLHHHPSQSQGQGQLPVLSQVGLPSTSSIGQGGLYPETVTAGTDGMVFTTNDPTVLQPFGGEIMDSIFTPTQSESTATSTEQGPGLVTLPYHDDIIAGQQMQQQQQQVAPGLYRDYSMNSTTLGNAANNNNQQQQHQALLIHNASFSSSDDEHTDAFGDVGDPFFDPEEFDGSRDELDNYKNQDLETLRDAVEDAVDGAEGMMSLAVTRALTMPEDASLGGLPWAMNGAVSRETSGSSVEASCLCETYDWLKMHALDESGVDAINEYFQDVLNRLVITVMFGMISPLQASQLVHACATILGMDLYKEFPGTTLVITGMRKTNDLAQGHNFIIKAFKGFGNIEDAAIAPNNRGFGFVRFTKPESVKRALKRFREYEIEIQDVSVSIKTLKNERPR